MGLPALVADYLFIAPLVQARLESQVPDAAAEVVEAADQLLRADRRSAVLHVMWAGDAFGDAANAGRNQIVTQRWAVVLGLNNAAARAEARQAKAGPLLSAVHRALAGWVPEGAVRGFRRAQAPLRPQFTTERALYPLGFEIDLSL